MFRIILSSGLSWASFLSFWGCVSNRRISSGDPSANTSGWQKRGHSFASLRTASATSYSVILNGALAEWRIPTGDPSANASGWQRKKGDKKGNIKGSFLRFAQDSVWHFLFCHSERSVSGVKNPHRRPFGLTPQGDKRSCHSEGALATEESPQETLQLTPQGDKEKRVTKRAT